MKKDYNNATVLVVEDEEYNFNYLEELFKQRNIKYIHAKTGEEAVNLFNQNPNIDLILMDIRLPIMNGYDATKEIRKINKKMPIIAQTAYALTGDREKALKDGCNDYIPKPIVEQQLMILLAKYLKI